MCHEIFFSVFKPLIKAKIIILSSPLYDLPPGPYFADPWLNPPCRYFGSYCYDPSNKQVSPFMN